MLYWINQRNPNVTAILTGFGVDWVIQFFATLNILKDSSGWCRIGFYLAKKILFLKTSMWLISMTFCPNSMRNCAFESPWCIFLQNQKIFHPSSIPFDSCYNWGRMNFSISKIWDFPNFYPSSMVAEIKGNWGRIKIFFILWKYASRAFKRTISRYFKPISHWQRRF